MHTMKPVLDGYLAEGRTLGDIRKAEIPALMLAAYQVGGAEEMDRVSGYVKRMVSRLTKSIDAAVKDIEEQHAPKPLPYVFDLVFDIKNTEQLFRTYADHVSSVRTIERMCAEHGIVLPTVTEGKPCP